MLLKPRIDEDLKVISEKLIQTFTMMVLADIHYFSHEKQEALLNLVATIIETYRPKYVVIPGDLFDNADILGNVEEMTYFMNWLTRISKISKVYISKGNHDQIVKVGKKWEGREEFAKEKFNLYFNDNIPNVALATETPIIIPEDGITITGFDPGYNWYGPSVRESKTVFAELFNNFVGSLNLPPDMLSVLLSHPTAGFVNEGELVDPDLIPDIPFDFIACGHNHGGMLGEKEKKILAILTFGIAGRKHKGLLGPHSVPFLNDCYGEYFGRTTLVDTRGITKASDSSGVFSKINGLYRPDMNLVTFQKSDLEEACELRDRLNVDPRSVDAAQKRYVKRMFPENSKIA